MNSSYNFLKIIFLFLTLNACTVSSNQLERFYSSEKAIDSKDFYWKVTYDKVNYQLIAIEMPNGTLFADRHGNSLFFDGWSINSIVGFGDFNGEYELQETEVGSLEFNADNSYVLENSCGEWSEKPTDDGLIYIQSCGNEKKFTNKLFVNMAGEVTQIQQFLEPFNKLMTLKKQN